MQDAMEALEALEQKVQRQDAEERAAKAIAEARARLVLGRDAKSAFFATLALRLELEADWSIETMAVDGLKLSYNPEFVLGLQDSNQLSQNHRVTVVAHEVMHCVLGHHTRRGSRDGVRWNEACDLAVNPILVEAGFGLPYNAYLPGRQKHRGLPAGLTAEEYYSRLGEDPDGEEGGQGQGDGDGSGNGQGSPDPGGCGGVEEPGDGSQADKSESQAQWDVATAQAAQASKSRGSLPGSLARVVEEMLEPKVDWREVLREFVSRQARNDYAWTPPNRRFLWQGLYLPGLRSEELGEVVVAVDTSGSIGQPMLDLFAGELEGILAAYNCKITIVYHDHAIQHIQYWSAQDGPLVLEPKGGGGTSHIPVFDWVRENAGDSPCLVCLTDLYTVFPQAAPQIPTLWAVVGNKAGRPPFGQKVEVE